MLVMLEVRELTVRYGELVAAEQVSLCLDGGEIGCLVGPSGCGKTSVLRAIAGFLRPATGTVTVDGEVLSDATGIVPPEHRQVGMVPQDLALFPHLSVSANIGFGLGRLDRDDRTARVRELLALTGLDAFAAAHPHELSGGQQQRVAIARAMAPRPRLLLLDEPFSSLDPQLRDRLPRDLRRLFREDGMTVLLVTHDQREAFAMADQVGLMYEGRLEQWDTSYGLYHRPATRTVAGFVGEGILIPGTVTAGDAVETELGTLGSDEALAEAPGDPVDLLVRPDDVIHDDESDFGGTIVARTFRGAAFLYTVELASGTRLLCLAPSHHDHAIGEQLGLRLSIHHLVLFPR